jgi:hypothetical protein
MSIAESQRIQEEIRARAAELETQRQKQREIEAQGISVNTPNTLPPLNNSSSSVNLSGITVKSATTGSDKYIVDENGIQKVMTGDEIKAKGGTIPEPIRQESEIHTQVMQGTSYEKAVENVKGKEEAAKAGMTQQELTQRITGVNREDELQKLADKYGMSLTSAADTARRFNLNPDAPEFANLNQWERRDLANFEGAKDYLDTTAENVAWTKLNNANKKNPKILTTSWDGGQHNILNLEEAAASGLTDPEIFNLVGREQAGSPVPTLIKANKDDPGTLYKGGWTGVTKNQIYEILNTKRDREELDTLLKDKGVTRDDNAAKLIGAGIDDTKTLKKLGYDVTEEDIKSVKDFNDYIKAKDTPQELKDAYKKGGAKGYETALATYKAEGDKQLAELRDKDPYLASILANDGYDEYVKAFNKRQEDLQAIQDRALAKLGDYEIGKLKPGESGPPLENRTFNIIAYLRDNSDSQTGKPHTEAIQTLEATGYDAQDIKNIVDSLAITNKYWTKDGKFQPYNALVAGVDQKYIQTITGGQIDVSKPVPYDTFMSVYNDVTREKPLNEYQLKERERALRLGLQDPQGPPNQLDTEWYKKAEAKYNEIYGKDEAAKAWGRKLAGEVAGTAVQKAIEPTLGWKTITTGEYVMGAVNVALLTMPFWLPKVGAIMPKFSKVVIPTTEGEYAWKGLTIAKEPIIGKSPSGLTVGRNIKLPEAKMILEGYKPETIIETKVFVNPEQLKASGFSESEITKLTTTLKERNMFAGKKSPYLNNETMLEPTARLDTDEIGVLVKQINSKKGVEGADLVYGSTTIKTQLEPELRGWRQVHDWDIRTNLNADETANFAQQTLQKLRELPGNREYRIRAEKPHLIEKNINGEWEHVADIHSKEVSPGASEAESKLDTTGAKSYGREVSEPAIKIRFKNGETLDIMTLSESGVRKADTILRVRGEKFYPPERGIAKPGIPKDIADFYVILRTFKGEKTAGKFAEAWGLKPDDILSAAIKDPPKFQYRITPSSKSAKTGSLTFNLNVPKALSKPLSAKLVKDISQGISSNSLESMQYKISDMIKKSSTSAKLSQLPSTKASSTLPGQSPATVFSPGRVSGQVLRPSTAPTSPSKGRVMSSASPLSGKPSGTSRGTSGGSPSIGITPSQSRGTLTIPSPGSPSNSESPSPPSSPGSPSPGSPSSPPSLPPPSPPDDGGKSIILPNGASNAQKREYINSRDGSIGWKQGKTQKGLDIWHVIMFPYQSQEDYMTVIGKRPNGAKVTVEGAKSAYKTAAVFYGKKPSHKLQVDMGIEDVNITPTSEGIRLKFTPDLGQKTTGDITIGKGKSSFPLQKGKKMRRLPR